VGSLERHAVRIVDDSVSVFPFAGVEATERDAHRRLAGLILQLLMQAARYGELDTRDEAVGDLRQAADDRRLTVHQLYGLVYLVEQAALDELALDESLGTRSEPWPALTRIVRRSSFDLLSAYAERLTGKSTIDALTDALTTLHTKAVLIAATDKEIQRAGRLDRPFALILVDVDHCSEINASHGHGSGDRVLERLGILMRNYFREQDWVGRFSGDCFGVLLPETQPADAARLAERVRATVEGRMALHDYRSAGQVPVTVSVAVLFVASVNRETRAEQLFEDARRALHKAKNQGRNRVEQVEVSVPRSESLPRDVTPFR
jgi:diguanylate cyclase (GGDEF)-like protein